MPAPQTPLKNMVEKEPFLEGIITYIQNTPVSELVNVIEECMQARVGKPQQPFAMHRMAAEEGHGALQLYLTIQAQYPKTLAAATDVM